MKALEYGSPVCFYNPFFPSLKENWYTPFTASNLYVSIISIYRLPKVFKFYLFYHADCRLLSKLWIPAHKARLASAPSSGSCLTFSKASLHNAKLKALKSTFFREYRAYRTRTVQKLWCPAGWRLFATCQDNLSALEHGLFWTHAAPRNRGRHLLWQKQPPLPRYPVVSMSRLGITCADVFDTAYA